MKTLAFNRSAPLPRRQRRSLQGIFTKYWQDYLAAHPQVPDYVDRNIHKVVICRTEELGGSVRKCPDCGYLYLIKHSCKSRFCPSCGTVYVDKWADKVGCWLDGLATKYYFVTFTLPPALKELVKLNKKLLLNAFFTSAAWAITSFARTKGFLPGFITQLQCAGRVINWHPHLHILLTAGGLNLAKDVWVKGYFPVDALRDRFKRMFFRKLRAAFKEEHLVLP